MAIPPLCPAQCPRPTSSTDLTPHEMRYDLTPSPSTCGYIFFRDPPIKRLAIAQISTAGTAKDFQCQGICRTHVWGFQHDACDDWPVFTSVDIHLQCILPTSACIFTARYFGMQHICVSPCLCCNTYCILIS